MRKTKRYIVFVLCMVMLLATAACGKKEDAPDAGKSPEATESGGEETAEPGEITEGQAKKLADEKIKEMTIEQKVGQLFVVNFELLDAKKGSYYEHRKITKRMKKTLQKYPVGGVVFFSRNINTRKQTTKFITKLQEHSQIPLFITVDEEGGDVARIGSNDNMRITCFPTMEEIGKSANTQYAYDMGATIGSEIKELGFNVNFAPVADVKTSESNTEIGSRSFGQDEKLVANMVVNVVKGLQDQGISATLKHFPGHGGATADSHEGSVNVDSSISRMRKVDFVPFQKGIEAGADFVMISHISVSRVTESTTPATLSSLIMQDILREELGFEGVIITDAMDMKAITDIYTPAEAALQSFKAGADIILMPDELGQAYDAVYNAVKSGKIKQERLDASVKRILAVKYKRGIIRT